MPNNPIIMPNAGLLMNDINLNTIPVSNLKELIYKKSLPATISGRLLCFQNLKISWEQNVIFQMDVHECLLFKHFKALVDKAIGAARICRRCEIRSDFAKLL